jgi:DNA modification methylase
MLKYKAAGHFPVCFRRRFRLNLARMNQLFFGDNLNVLRESVKDESVDLIYLDPPFNSKRDYNLLFKSPKGHESEAQIEAFKDSWSWGGQAEREFDEIVHGKNTDVAEMMVALRKFLGQNDMMAYLTMMANRLLELHRVLKATGSLYLHCDPTASHYLKIVLDAVFGKTNFRSEISWKRSSAHNDAKQGRKLPGNIRDIVFFYTKSDKWKWNWAYTPYDESYVREFYHHVEEKTGRKYRLDNLTAAKPGGDVSYEFHGTRPYKGRYWAYSRENMEKFFVEGRLYFPKNGGTPNYKRYLDEMPGVPIQNDWNDIRPVPANEYLGYPTQKPLALLQRIISISSNEGDVILDPFCGCGTAVHAAQNLKRKWIGVDITHLAISLIEKRLKDAFGKRCKFDVHGTPQDVDAARDLALRDKYQFQWWAVSLVDAQPFQGKKKGADGGIDGIKFFHDVDKAGARKIIVSVKGGGLKADDIRSLMAVREREGAEIALFISLEEPTRGMIGDAASAGFYESVSGKKFPCVQLLTIEGLLSGKQRAEHPDHAPDLNFKKAKAESNAAQKSLL